MFVPFYDDQDERDQFNHWAEVKGAQGIKQYRKEKNAVSLDGKLTGIQKQAIKAKAQKP